MKERDLKNIKLNRNALTPKKQNTKLKDVAGFDTETENGECFLIGVYDKKGFNVLGSKDPDQILSFITQRKYAKTTNFFYNINYDFQAIIKLLPYENLKDLAKWEKTIYKNYKIEYIQNKMFSISKNKYKIKFYDLAQFFNFNSLNNSALKFLGYGKEDLKNDGVDIKNLSFERYKEDLEYKKILDKYLCRDVEITYKLGNKLNDLVKPYLIPKTYYSQAGFSQQYFLEHLHRKMNLPSKRILQLALNCYQGGRFETFTKGNFKNAYVADIKSAYPYHNINIPALDRGIWKQDLNYRSDALISLYKIDTEVYDLKISPLKYQLKNNMLLYPIGKFKDLYMNKSEIEILNKLGFKYKIKDAYHYLDPEPEYPYSFLKTFYDQKEKFKAEDQKELSFIPKIILNGFYGKTIQINPMFDFTKKYRGDKNLYDINIYKDQKIYTYRKYKAGVLFNPIVANEITANARTQLYNASMKQEKHIIGYQTDSIITDKKINLDYGHKLGSWEIENQGRLLILGSGVYQLLDQKNKILKTRMRGFAKTLDLYNLLNENLDQNSINISLTRNHKLKKTLKLKLDQEEKLKIFNLINPEDRAININFDKKRIWERDFNNCREVLEDQIHSKPIYFS